VVDTADVGSRVLDRYRIIRRIAVGGMGDIYLARTEGAAGFVRPVVIKQVKRDLVRDPSTVRMFEREARINARLSHPHIVDVLDFREERGAYLMVMEFVNGVSLSAWLSFRRKRGRLLGPSVASVLMEQVLDALSAVHGLVDADGNPRPIVHRDISPSNVLLDAHGHVKLMDFGIARLSEPDDPQEYATETHTIKGKVAYIPPEVLEGKSPTPQSDLYAVGVVLHEMLAGRNELRAPQVAEVLNRVLTHELTPLVRLRNDVSMALSEVVARATEKDPDDRYGDAASFRAALQAARPMPAEAALQTLRTELEADLGDPQMESTLGDLHPTQLDRTWREFSPEDVSELRFEGEAADETLLPPEEGSAGPTRTSTPGGGPPLELQMETLAEQTARLQAELPNHIAKDREAPSLDLDEAALEKAADPNAGAAWPDEVRTRPGRGRFWAGALGLAIFVAAVGAGAYLWTESPGSLELPFSAPFKATAVIELDPTGDPETGPSRRVHFEKQVSLLKPCVERHGGAPSKGAEARFKFDINVAGRVKKVLLAPPSLAKSPLGECLRRSAAEIRFGEGQGGRFDVLVSLPAGP
jgi:serine/threonine protein kinase